MAISEGFDFIQDAFVNQTWLGADWIIPLAVIFLSILLVTRDKEEWKILFFPMALAWLIGGLRVNLIILLIAGMLFAIETISIPVLGRMVQTISGITTSGVKSTISYGKGKVKDIKLAKASKIRDMKILKGKLRDMEKEDYNKKVAELLKGGANR